MGRLTAEAVYEIRTSRESAYALARKFGVGPTAILDVRNGKRWTKPSRYRLTRRESNDGEASTTVYGRGEPARPKYNGSGRVIAVPFGADSRPGRKKDHDAVGLEPCSPKCRACARERAFIERRARRER